MVHNESRKSHYMTHGGLQAAKHVLVYKLIITRHHIRVSPAALYTNSPSLAEHLPSAVIIMSGKQ